jgi:hypothetical protein
MVDTCPNCGQPSRAGARFCTSCGFRLPERPVDSESAPLSRSPFATTSTVAASMWPSSSSSNAAKSAASTTPEPIADNSSIEGSPSDLPDEIALPGPATTAQSAEPRTDEAPSEPIETQPPVESEPQPQSEPQSEPSYPVWPTFPSYGSTTNGNDAPAWYAEDVPSESEATADSRSREAEVAEESSFEQTATDNAQSEPASEAESVAAYVGDYESSTDSPDEAIAAPTPSVSDMERASESEGWQSSDTLERAQALVAELSALLPTLGANVASSTQISPDIAESLAAVKSDDVTEFDALMEAVAAVRARPRDIDVVLGLSRHVDAVVHLKDRYDQAQAAIGEALARLDTQKRADNLN